MTVWEHMRENWTIKKWDLRLMTIDPNKPWREITLEELWVLADHLDVRTEDLV